VQVFVSTYLNRKREIHMPYINAPPPVIPDLIYDPDECRYCLPAYGGGATIMLIPDAEYAAWRLTALRIHPQLRGRGLGRQLLTAVTDWADAAGQRLTLFAEPIREPAGEDGLTSVQLIRWYKRHGFVHLPRKHRSVLIRLPLRRGGVHARRTGQARR
jgi:GNAT superfamily N-acetyltransferase